MTDDTMTDDTMTDDRVRTEVRQWLADNWDPGMDRGQWSRQVFDVVAPAARRDNRSRHALAYPRRAGAPAPGGRRVCHHPRRGNR